MIVSIGLGEDGVNVCLDDQINSYDPLRTVEMCREARKLFAGAYLDTLDKDEPADEPALEEQPE